MWVSYDVELEWLDCIFILKLEGLAFEKSELWLKVAVVFVIMPDSGSGEVCFEPCLFHHLIFLDKKHLLPLPTQVLKIVSNVNILPQVTQAHCLCHVRIS